MARLLVQTSSCQLLSPFVLEHEVAFEDRLDCVVLQLLILVEKFLLKGGELSLVYSQETTLRFCYTRLKSGLGVDVKQYFFSNGPTYINMAQSEFCNLLG